MALSNRDRIGKALEVLSAALAPFVTRVLESCDGLDWQQNLKSHESISDVQLQLKLMRDNWDAAFRKQLDRSHRSFVFELTDVRNDWAHQKTFSSNDTDRALDTATRLCQAIAAPDQQQAIQELREELQQIVFAERARNKTRYQASVENQVKSGLIPWRDVITPHPDVINGRYQQAEFAADLDLVQRGIGSAEYTDPVEFYRRTFITDGHR